MSFSDLLGLLGGLALFLYGMQMMSDGLENAAGDKMKDILEKLTSSRFLGVAVGAIITAIIQSSSATTVMVVGFVNSKMMNLKQAVWIIMGANIGTTITGQLIALDIGYLAPLIAFIGVALTVFIKKPKIKYFGLILAGLGVLFIGMDMMSEAMKPLQNSPTFISLMTSFSNPLIGILAGTLFTALIQSSSASVGILQTLAHNGLISFNNSVFVLFGQNIGTCITAVLASIGTSTNAKRTTIIHLSFNIIGTLLFTTLCLLFPLTSYVEGLTPDNPAAQIANMHTFFNIVTTCLLLPFGEYLAKFAKFVLKDQEEKASALSFNDTFSLGSGAMHSLTLINSLNDMLDLAKTNVHDGFEMLIKNNTTHLSLMKEKEKMINKINKKIIKYITHWLSSPHNEAGLSNIEEILEITSNIERIGDHAMNLAEYEEDIYIDSLKLSKEDIIEICSMQSICDHALDYISKTPNYDEEFLIKVSAYEQNIDDMTKNYKTQHIERMKLGLCSEEACVIYSELLMNFERIGDHILNIGQALYKMSSNKK